MSTYDSYEAVEAPRRHKHRHHHRDRDDRDDRDFDPEPRYVETRETYVRGPAPVVDAPYPSRETDLIRRPGREDSDLSVEEVRREFPPPAGAYVSSRSMIRNDRYGPPVRSRSMERDREYGQYLGDPRDDRHPRRKVVKEEVIETRRRSLSRNQKILAGVAGAALAVGGKELWDRRQNHGQAPEDRNLFATAAVGAAGAVAGYEGAEFANKKFGGEKEKKVKDKTYMAYKGRDGEVAEYFSSGSDNEKPKKSRRKSIIEGALGLAGVGAAAKAASSGRRDDRDDGSDRRSRRRSGSGESTRSRRRDKSRGGEEGVAKYQQAAKAALLAGAAEAFRVRNEPGGLSGAKAKRIVTAAIGAAGIDAAADRDPEHHSKRHILEAVIGGLAGNRLINGSKNELETGGRGGRSGRSRSRSRAPSSSGLGGGAGLAALATAGLGALAGKKLLDRSRSRSRGGDDRDDRRSRRRSPSEDSFDDRRDRRRSKSVSDRARGALEKGLAGLGIGAAAEAGRDDRRRDREVVEETHVTRRSRRSHDDSDDDYDDRRDDRSRGDPYGDSRDSRDGRSSRRKKEGQRDKRVAEGKQSDSDADSLGSSSGDEKRVKKMKGKQFLTAGLATVATIHAAHNVYQSYEKREARKKAVESGQMSKEEAKRLKSKAVLQDAASIGIAALGIKGAVSEWKEMREMRHEYKEFEGKKEERHKKRQERQQRQKRLENGSADGSDDGAARTPHYSSAPEMTYGGRYTQQSPHYVDGNPYGGLPEPPVGYAYAPRR